MKLAEMEQALNNFNRRLSATEEILPTLATKADLERFATKADLERFATKADLAAVRSELLIRIERLDDKFDTLAEVVAAHGVKLERIDAIEERLMTHDVKLDGIVVALRSLTERLERKGVI